MAGKKIGIITMHKVLNYGSVFQAYALQKAIDGLGYSCELIDYKFPYDTRSFIQKIQDYLRIKVYYRLRYPQNKFRQFDKFYTKYLNCSRPYNRKSIQKNPPKYDIYMTGSDQVWNCRWTNGDTNFLLSFAPNGAPRLSYASSFSSLDIPEQYKSEFVTELGKYNCLSVRETNGSKIIEALIDKNAEIVCDPTLLLTQNTYAEIAKGSNLHLSEKFILVYVLGYMYNPYPEVDRIINAVEKELGYKVLFLDCVNPDKSNSNRIELTNIGPCEFLWLFQNASFVITTSFHGTAFSVINHRPLLSVVQRKDSGDDRIATLLNGVGLQDALIEYNSVPSDALILSSRIVSSEGAVAQYRSYSVSILKNMIEACDSLKN